MPGVPYSHAGEYPNQNGLYDTGCRLWIWAKEKNGNGYLFKRSIVTHIPQNIIEVT